MERRFGQACHRPHASSVCSGTTSRGELLCMCHPRLLSPTQLLVFQHWSVHSCSNTQTFASMLLELHVKTYTNCYLQHVYWVKKKILLCLPLWSSLVESPQFLADLPDFEKKIVPRRRLHWIHRLYLYSCSLNLSSVFPSFLSSCPPFFLFLFGIIAIIQLHHNRKKAVLGSCFIVVEFLSPPKRYKKGGFKSFLSPFFSTPWLTSIIFESFFVPNKDIHEGGAEVRGSTWETRDVTTYFIRGIHRASIQSETCTNSVVFGARSGPLSS